MEYRIIKILSIVITLTAAIGLVILVAVPGLHSYALSQKQEEKRRQSVLSLMQNSKNLTIQEDSKMQGQIRLTLPKGMKQEDMIVQADPVECGLSITIPGISEYYFYDYPIVGSAQHVENLYFDTDASGGTIQFELDQVYEPEIKSKDGYLYISFVSPKELYDHVVVVDAGHGGKDIGASAAGVEEKNLCLDITKKLKDKLDEREAMGDTDGNGKQDLKVYYTRLDDEKIGLEHRVNLANNTGADLFLSIHINSTASGRESAINGTEVMYKVEDTTGASKAFADTCLTNLLTSLSSQSKGLVAGDDIKIIRLAKMPVALAEIGFITNGTERERMQTEDYQNQAAQGLYDSLITSLGL